MIGWAADAVHSGLTLAARGFLQPGRPDRVARQLWALQQWGYGIAAETRSAAARDPGRAAIVDDDGTLTYLELLATATDRAHDWQDRGIGPAGRLGLLRRNGRDFVIDIVAAGLLGADIVLLNTGLAEASRVAIAEEQRLDGVLSDPEFAAGDMPTAQSGRREPLRPPERDGRTIVLTSGTTGTPKGAVRPPTPGLAPLVSILSRIPIRVGSRILISAPMFHTWGLAGLQIALATRATIVLRRRFDAADCLDTLARERCDVLFAVPVMLSRLLDEPRRAPLPLAVAAVSGSALPGGLAHAFMDAYGDVLYNLYGSTEASWVSIADPSDLRRNPATAGRAPRGTQIRILDEYGHPAPRGTIFVGNDMLFEGYTNAVDGDRRDGLLSTGDIGHLEGDLLFVDGRADDMVISGAENIYPSTVEQVLATVPGIADVAVVGVPDEEFGERLAAWVVTRPDAAMTADDVRAAVRRALAGFYVPRDVHFVTELPRNATGKVLRRNLR